MSELHSGDRVYYRDSWGRKKEVTVSGLSEYNATVVDEFGRRLEFPVGKLQPIEKGDSNVES